MHHEDALPDLIGGIYETAVNPASWPEVLGNVASFVGGQSVGLVSSYMSHQRVDVHRHFGCDPHYLQLYHDQHLTLDPLSPLASFAVGDVATFQDHMPKAEFHDGRFYREWLRPQGMVDTASVVLEKTPTSTAFFAVTRGEATGPVDADTRRRMEILVPHVRRAVRIGKVVELGQAEISTFVDMLDGLRASVLLVDENGRIVHANAASRALLATGDPLRDIRGRLTARDAMANGALQAAFAAAGDEAARVGDIALPVAAFDGVRYVAHVLPLTSSNRRPAGVAPTAVAALFVHQATVDSASLAEALARHFKLTPTEIRVLLAIVEIGGGPEVAEALGIAGSTVKTHLSRLYQKTGTGRQADLVKLMAEFSSPLIG
jgi:DNA-binding CsgD family transcriptional regulator